MDEYEEEADLDEEQDSEDEEPDQIEPPEGESISRQQYEKVVKEARSLRTKLRRTEFAAEFGADVVELVPTSLPLKEQKELAAKLKERLAPAAPAPAVEGLEVDVTEAADQPSEQELRASALVRSGSGSPGQSVITDVAEVARLAFSDPAGYERAKKAGLVQLERLPGHDKE